MLFHCDILNEKKQHFIKWIITVYFSLSLSFVKLVIIATSNDDAIAGNVATSVKTSQTGQKHK